MIARIISTTLTAALALGACTSTLPAGAACQQTSECDSNLMCLDVAQFSGTTCTVIGKACTVACTTGGNECAALGSHYMCFAGCNNDMFCGATP